MLGLPRITIIALVWLVLPTLAQPKPTKEITESEIKGVINTYSDCESLNDIQLDHLEYFDFTGDGQKEAVASPRRASFRSSRMASASET